MPEFKFSITLNTMDELTEKDIDKLYEAGCNDATIGSSNYTNSADFDREAPDLGTAVGSAVNDIVKAGQKIFRIDFNEDEPLCNRLEEARANGFDLGSSTVIGGLWYHLTGEDKAPDTDCFSEVYDLVLDKVKDAATGDAATMKVQAEKWEKEYRDERMRSGHNNALLEQVSRLFDGKMSDIEEAALKKEIKELMTEWNS